MSKQFIRPGFQDCDTSNRVLNIMAAFALKNRLKLHSRKLKVSTFLMRCRTPKAIGVYKTKDNSRYCVLGVMAKKSGAFSHTGEILWRYIWGFFNCTEKEFDRSVPCPMPWCYHHNLIVSMLPHLNDKHDWSFKRMGKWLRKYNL